MQNALSRKAQQRDERYRQRFELVREILRYRMDQSRLLGPLNELPVFFANDAEVMRLYRFLLSGPPEGERTEAVGDLIVRLANLVNIPSSVLPGDLHRGFVIR